jgi:tetratricopeptide (TPR) repeat protein
MRAKRFILPALGALMLAGCSDAAPEGTAPFVSDNVEFVELLDDARGEMSEGNFAEADRLLKEARAIEPENPALWVDIARLRFQRGEHIAAIEAADRAIKLGPDYGPALFMRAQLVRDANGLSDALPWFEAAVTADPKNPEVLADYAATLGDLGRNRDMLKVVRQIQGISPGYPQVHFLQAVLAARAGEPVLARSLLAKSGLFQRGVPSALLLDAVIDIQQRTPDTAIATLEKLALRQPGNRRVRDLMALALWVSGRDDELIARFSGAAIAPDASPYLTMLVGRAYERRGDRERAAPLIEQALASREVQLAALSSVTGLPEPTARLRTMVATRDGEGAQALAARLLSQSGGSSYTLALTGDAALMANDIASAMARYTRASTIRRPWPLTRKIIYTTRALGDDKAADALLARAVIGEPRNTEALLMLAQRSAESEDWARVAKLTKLVFALGAGNDPKVLDLQARAAEALGNAEEAANWDLTAEAVRPGRFVRAN